MLSSSKEYIEALRAGKYLRFLEWPYFIIQKYNITPDADELVNLLVFDLLNNGFCEEDAKAFSVIDAVTGLESFRGNLSYSITSISIAVFQCMVYESKGIKHRFIYEEAKNKVDIIKFMKKAANCLDTPTFDELLTSQQTKFFDWSKTADPKAVEVARQQIIAITALRYTLEDYWIQLKASKPAHDKLRLSRLGIANKLAEYLNEQTELTPGVIEEVSNYVNKIRSMQPMEFEQHYLNAISPPPSSDNTWHFLTNFGISFFKILQKPENSAVPVVGKENSI